MSGQAAALDAFLALFECIPLDALHAAVAAVAPATAVSSSTAALVRALHGYRAVCATVEAVCATALGAGSQVRSHVLNFYFLQK